MNYIEKYALVNKDIVGEIQGAVYDKYENSWHYYLEKELQKKEDCDLIFNTIIKSKIDNVAILHNIAVLQYYRGQGYGKSLIEMFEQETFKAQITILVADMLSPQKKGFKLLKWYQNLGYYIFTEQKETVIMIKTKDPYIIQKMGLYLILM